MAIKINERENGKVLEMEVSGKLTHNDYRDFVPEFDRLTGRHGTVNILFVMVDFHGLEAAALWDDFKVGIKHYTDIERLGVVGDKKWEKTMTALCRPFTRAKVRYFDLAALDEARTWAAAA